MEDQAWSVSTDSLSEQEQTVDRHFNRNARESLRMTGSDLPFAQSSTNNSQK